MFRIAKMISFLGHPLIIGILYVMLMGFKKLPPETAILISGLIVGIVLIPITLHNWLKSKNGSYTNFDVSDQKQRRGFYPFAIGLFTLVLILFYSMQLPRDVIWSTGLFLILLLLMAILNYKIKASLHGAIAFYIAINLFEFGYAPGMFMLVFALMITWSRWQMRRHAFTELIVGGLLGIIVGLISHWILME